MTDEKELQDRDDPNRVLRNQIEDYKAAKAEMLPELDYSFLLKSLELLNEASPVKIARNAVDENREWIHGTETHNVKSVYLSDDHCVVFVISHGDKVMTVADLSEVLEDINKKLPLKEVPVLIEINEETRVKVHDMFAHSLIQSMWAGMPVDFVLCYNQKVEKKRIPLSVETE